MRLYKLIIAAGAQWGAVKDVVGAALLAALCCAPVSGANAQFDPSVSGVPGAYSASNVSGWSLERPIDPAAPTWRPDASRGAAAGEPTNCNIIVAALTANPSVVEATIDFFDRMTGDEYGAFMRGQTPSDAGIIMSEFTSPERIVEDGFPGLRTEYKIDFTKANAPMRAIAYQIFVDGAFSTVTCGSQPTLYPARRPWFLTFVDDVQFGGGGSNTFVSNPSTDNAVIENASIGRTLTKDASMKSVAETMLSAAQTLAPSQD